MQVSRIIKLINNRIFRNGVFWLLFSYFHFFPQNNVSGFITVLGMCLIFYAVPVYMNNLFLIPRYLLKRQYFVYVLLFSALFVFTLSETYYINDWASKALPYLNYTRPFGSNMYYHVFHIVLLFTLLAFGKFLSDAIENQRNLELLNKHRLETELEGLKSQINPHFLFNALNTIYGMARRTDMETASAVLTLSDILRHNIYQSSEPSISIHDEIIFLKQFISFSSMRLYYKNNIDFRVDGCVEHQSIAPLLLLPFVENAIKHGLDNHYSESWVKINLKLTEDLLEFSCINSCNIARNGHNKNNSGFGLQNVKRRMELCYPGRHELIIADQNDEYHVNLKIHLS